MFPGKWLNLSTILSLAKTFITKLMGNLWEPGAVQSDSFRVLSPINYSIYTRKIHLLILGNCFIIEFADDIAILCHSTNPTLRIKSFQQCLSILSDSLGQRGLELYPGKPKLVLFNRQNLDTSDPSFTLSLNNIITSPSIHVRFLGIVLDIRLSFQFHFLYLSDKYEKS